MSQNVSQTHSDRGRFFDTLKKFNNDVQDEINRQECAVQKLEQEIVELRLGNEALKDENRKLKEEIKRLNGIDAQLKNLQETNTLFAKEIIRLQEEIGRLEKENIREEAHTNAMAKTNKEWNSIVGKVHAENAELQRKLKREENVIHAKTKEIENFVASVKVMKEQYDAREKDFCERIKNLSDGKSQAERLVMEKHRFIENMQATLQDHVSTINNYVSTIHSLEKDKTDLTLSKVAGANLTYNNPNIADLSDENRPTKLAEEFSELYENEWSDAFEAVHIKNDREKTRFMLEILKRVSHLCHDISRNHMEAIKKSLSTLVILDLWEEEEEPVEEVIRIDAALQTEQIEDVFEREDEHESSHPESEKADKDIHPNGDNGVQNELSNPPDDNENKRKDFQKSESTKRCSRKTQTYFKTLSTNFDQLTNEQKKTILDIRKLFENQMSKDFHKAGQDILAKEIGIEKQPHEFIDIYIAKCMKICWSMCRHEPPVHIHFPEIEWDLPYDTNMYKPYTKTGKHLDFVVWPALYLHKNGPMLAKGVAQGRK